MEKEFVPYELALELKQLGFEEPCLSYYEGESFSYHLASIKGDDYIIPAPLYQQAFRWFREKYNMNHSIIFHETTFSNDYQYLVLSNDNEFVEVGYTTHEEAELACLKKLIEIVKTK